MSIIIYLLIFIGILCILIGISSNDSSINNNENFVENFENKVDKNIKREKTKQCKVPSTKNISSVKNINPYNLQNNILHSPI